MSRLTKTALIAAVAIAGIGAQQPKPVTRAEGSGFEETSRYADVRSFIDALAAQTKRVRVETFGTSEEGRELPLLVIGDPPAAVPPGRSGRQPVVLVFANIHAGEVEGKEAALHLARRLTTGDLQGLLSSAVWLFAPIYNADGNERISPENRVEQHGPMSGVGTRENARGLDLNRDFMKLESAEARALVALMSRWDPDVVVDLHTTNGSYHGYHLTYAPPLNPNSDAGIAGFVRDRLLPTVRRAVETRHGYRTYYYGNFAAAERLDATATQPVTGEGRTPVWRTFDQRPRFGTNYVGLRNRIAVLSEAYSYLDFAGRVKATEAFVEEIMREIAARGGEIRRLTARADAETTGGRIAEAGVRFELRPVPGPVDILVGAVEQKVNPRSGRMMTAMVERVATPTRMIDYGSFAATERRRVPAAYVVSSAAGDLADTIARKLAQHGVTVETTTAAARVSVERFVVDRVARADIAFQGHRETSVQGRFERATVDVPAGSLVVRTGQALGRVVFHLLEPESDDGLTTWNFLDMALAPASPHPVMKVAPGQRVPQAR